MPGSLFRRVLRAAAPVLFFALQFTGAACHALTLEELAARIERLEVENRELKERLGKLTATQGATGTETESPRATGTVAPPASSAPAAGGYAGVGMNSQYSYRMLDPTTSINRKQLFLLDQRRSGALPADSLTVGGALTALVNAQNVNSAGQFGYLMRQPGNQVGRNASEAAIHSAQLGFTGTLGPWATVYSEILYDPEQSFGAGTNTALTRNQLQLRQGYVLFGNLDRRSMPASAKWQRHSD